MIVDAGSFAFGLTLGWAAAFAGSAWGAIGYRVAAGMAAAAAVWMIAPAGLVPALAGFAAGSGGHELFLWGLRRGVG